MQEKSVINRREGLLGVGVVAGAAAQSANGLAWSEGEAHKTRKCALDLFGFEPNSMLQVHESRVERARNGEVKTGASQFVPSISPLPVNCHFSQSLGPSGFATIGKRKLHLAWKNEVLNTSPSLTLLMKQTHLLSVSFQQQAACKLRLQGRAGRIDLAQILVVSIIMDAILPRSEPA
jgi:hypothetical protein